MISSQKPKYSKDEKVHVPDYIAKKILSIAPYLIHCATKSRIKTPKHYVLPLTVKSLTNSELVTILNRLGHGLLYSLIEEAETTLAEILLKTKKIMHLQTRDTC